MYGGETWPMTEMDMKKLNTRERKMLRKIYGMVEEQGMWGVRTNQELKALYKDLDRVADIKKEKAGIDRESSKNESWKGS